ETVARSHFPGHVEVLHHFLLSTGETKSRRPIQAEKMNAYSHENAALQAGRDRAGPANAWRDDHRRRAAKGKSARPDVKKRRNAPPPEAGNQRAISAATPGSSLPSIHSRKAPPAVETNEKSAATPAWLSAATVSPPPATETSEPSAVSAAAVRASATVAVSKGASSNAPSGPFHTRVRQVLSTSPSASTAAGPTSRIISPSSSAFTLAMR